MAQQISYSVLELDRGIPRAKAIQTRSQRLSFMTVKPYHAYMDESGTHEGSKVVAIAGYLSTYDSWNRWEQDWNPVMQHYAVTDFHMTDFEGRYREFEWRNYWWWPWADDIRIRLIERVTAICQQRPIIGLGCAVIREQYERILTDKIQGDLRHPYYFCMYACMNMLLHRLQNDTRLEFMKPVNFLFDQKKGRFRSGSRTISWEPLAQDYFQKIKSGLDPEGKILGSLDFGDRREYPQLRAADLITYEAARMARQLWEEPHRPIRKAMEVLKKDYNLLITFPTEQRMHNFVRIIEAATDAMNRGASDEEMEQIAKGLREEFEDKNAAGG